MEIAPTSGQTLFFTSIRYGDPYHITRLENTVIDDQTEVLLVTGIANPAPLKRWLDEHSETYYELAYSDHHIFSIDDLTTILRRFNSLTARNKLILTTEKDAVRLIKFRQELEDWPFYVLPIAPSFLFGQEARFTDLIVKFITEFQAPAGPGEQAQAISGTNFPQQEPTSPVLKARRQ